MVTRRGAAAIEVDAVLAAAYNSIREGETPSGPGSIPMPGPDGAPPSGSVKGWD
jgi:hypothetical protein